MLGMVAEWSVHPWILGDVGRWLSFYTYTARSFGADKLLMVGNPPSAHDHMVEGVDYGTYPELDGVFKDFPNASIVALSVDADHKPIPLKDFRHPQGDTLYVVGSDYGEVNYTVLDQYTPVYVSIEMAKPQPLWGHVALGIALQDRWCKRL
jgi:hypothetical protein